MKYQLIFAFAASLMLAACTGRQDLKAPCTASLDDRSTMRWAAISPEDDSAKPVQAHPVVRAFDSERCGIMKSVNSQ